MKLGDLIELKRGFDLPSKDRENGLFPVVSSSGISGFHSSWKLLPPGVITGRYGTLGKVFYIDQPYWPLNTSLYVSNFKGNDPLYVFYLLKTIDYLKYSDKAAVPGVNRNALHYEMVVDRPLHEQKAIAHILGALDDKIELNRQMNRTLEDIARTVFKAWFVDFEGQTEFEEIDGVKVPVGWKWEKIGDILELIMGQSPPGDSYNTEGLGMPFFQGATDFGFRYPEIRFFCSYDKPRRALYNDVLVSVRAPVGRVNKSFGDIVIGRGLAAVRHEAGYASYVYYLMLHMESKFNVFNGEGTVFGSLSSKDFKSIKILSPDISIVLRFENFARYIDKKIELSERQNKSLQKLRDTLLPKLISGELRVQDAERFL
jgi:type I restriction enzyme S subunit